MRIPQERMFLYIQISNTLKTSDIYLICNEFLKSETLNLNLLLLELYYLKSNNLLYTDIVNINQTNLNQLIENFISTYDVKNIPGLLLEIQNFLDTISIYCENKLNLNILNSDLNSVLVDIYNKFIIFDTEKLNLIKNSTPIKVLDFNSSWYDFDGVLLEVKIRDRVLKVSNFKELCLLVIKCYYEFYPLLFDSLGGSYKSPNKHKYLLHNNPTKLLHPKKIGSNLYLNMYIPANELKLEIIKLFNLLGISNYASEILIYYK